MDSVILARHGESIFSERGLVNGEVTVPGPLSWSSTALLLAVAVTPTLAPAVLTAEAIASAPALAA